MRLPRIRRPMPPCETPIPTPPWCEKGIPEFGLMVTVIQHSDGELSFHINPLTTSRILIPMKIFVGSQGIFDYRPFGEPGDDPRWAAPPPRP